MFVILLAQIPGQETTSLHIRLHVQHLKALDDAGKLVLCGPFTDYPGGMVIVRAADRDEAISIAKSDPFVTQRVRTYEVRSWLLATASNEYLSKIGEDDPS